MLSMIRSIQDICYSQIMRVYEESNIRYGKAQYPRLPAGLQLMTAEQDFYGYLQDFFCTKGAACAVWFEDGEYKSALRLEPYRDGYLLAGLETAPKERGKGYAKMLVREALSDFRKTSDLPVYSHVEKSNIVSLKLHKASGFVCIRESADYIDGTHHEDAFTLVWK